MSRIVLSNATLLDGENPPQAKKSVVIEGEFITAVGDTGSITILPDDRVIDLAGKTLMPGMVQAHWHGSYKGLDFEPPPVGLEKPPGYLMLLAATQAKLALDLGYTSVVGAAVGDALDAQLKMAITDGVVPGPRIFASGRWLITTGDSNDLPEFWWWGITNMGGQRICDGADEFTKAVRQEIKEGAEIIKIFNDSGHALLFGTEFLSMTDQELHAAVAAAHMRGKKIRSHVTGKTAILKCIEAGVDILDHCDHLDQECIDKIVESGTFVCPSVYLLKAILETVEAQGEGAIDQPFFDVMKTDYQNMREMLPYAAKAGAKFLIGDDWGTMMTPHGDYIKEFELYAECGVSNLDLIKWATKHGAECMGMGEQLGTVSKGKIADLLVIAGDPSEDISVLGDQNNIQIIMQAGQFYKCVLE